MMKRNLLLATVFLLGFLCAFSYQQFQINRTVKASNDDIQQAQKLFDIDQEMIRLDLDAYSTLQHCYDQPKTCNIFNPGEKADQFAIESMVLMKQKQDIITHYPYLIPAQYKAVWGVNK